MMIAQSLREMQQDMQRQLLGEASSITGAIVDAPPLSAQDRIAIYRNAYQVRLIDALQDTYPILHALLGDDMFIDLGKDFVAHYPSVFRSIRWYGRELTDFLKINPPYDEQPVLSEVAQLEWTLGEVFDAKDAKPLPRIALSAVDPAAWSELRFEFHPSLRRLQFEWNAVPVWQAMSQEDTPPRPHRSAAPVAWLLWRQDLQNYFRSMTNIEALALDAAQRGHNFGEICESLIVCLPENEIPLAAATLLGNWADSAMIVGIG
jgi:hypothetical protein